MSNFTGSDGKVNAALILTTATLAASLFLIKKHIVVLDDIWWIFCDWGIRAVAVAVMLAPAANRRAFSGLICRLPVGPYIAWTAATVMIGLGATSGAEFLFDPGSGELTPSPTFATVPTFLVVADGIIGLALVSLSEELITRGAPFLLLRDRAGWMVPGMLAASALFALLHFDHGHATVVSTFVTAIPLFLSLRATGSLWPALTAHYVINVVLFTLPRL